MNRLKTIGKHLLGNSFSEGSFLYTFYHSTRGIAAALFYGFPSRKLTVIGVTGTNGKTTTATLIASIIEAAGHKVGLATTINFDSGNHSTPNETKMTTLSPFILQAMVRSMVKNGCRYAVIETSSHALIQKRVWGIDYDVAVLTNLTPEHLDFHKTMEDYQSAKALLFSGLEHSYKKPGTPKVSVLNLDDPSYTHFRRFKTDQTIFYTLRENTSPAPNTIRAVHPTITAALTTYDLVTPIGSIGITSPLTGRFNIANELAAAGCALALNLPLTAIQKGIANVVLVPGRMEQINTGQSFRVIVDYAHTPDGYEQVLSTLRGTTTGKLITVFGSAGDRDKTKRPLLSRVASQYSDTLVLTEEDPGSEDVDQIIEEMLPGISDSFTESENFFIIPSRTAAIKYAFKIARPTDTVVLLGMGAQTVMATKTGTIPYNEREFANETLKSIMSDR